MNWLSEIETLIAVAGTLGGVFLGYLLDERRENRRVGREVALRPLADKERALKDVYRAMTDLLMETIRIRGNPGLGRTPLQSLIDHLESSVTWGVLWFSEKNGGRIMDGVTGLLDLARKSAKGGNLTEREMDQLMDYFIAAGKGVHSGFGNRHCR